MINKLGTLRVRLEKGDSFGEYALYRDRALRAATALALSAETECLVIYRRDYLSLVDSANQQRMQNRVRLVCKLPFISEIKSEDVLKNLLSAFKEATFNKGDCIVKAGD